MDTGNRLHAPAVAMGEARAIDRLGAADVGAAVTADRNGFVRGQPTGHARAPEQLVADRAVHDLMDLHELLQAGLGIGVHAGDEFELRLAEISGDVRMLERGSERDRMRGRRQRPIGPHPQAFLFDPAPEALQHCARHRLEALLAMHGGFGGHQLGRQRGTRIV